jgi:hypothetical protein
MFLLKKLKFIKKLKPKSQSHIHTQQDQAEQPRPICPWSERYLSILSFSSPSQFPQPGRALTATATASGELFLLGGFPPSTGSRHSAHNCLHMFSTRDLSVTLLQTSGEAPSPRFGHASALVRDDILIWGGATNTGDRGEFRRKGPHDNSLYLLNLGKLNLLISRPTLAYESFFTLQNRGSGLASWSMVPVPKVVTTMP